MSLSNISRERVIEKKDISLVQLATGEMVADMFTKQLPLLEQ
jgi:hypothetical protein